MMFDILVNEAELAEINLLVQGVRHDRIAKKGDWEKMFFDRVITFRHLGVMQITVTAVPAPSSGTGWLYQVKFETMENGYWSECWSFVSDPYEMKLKELILENLQMFYDTTQGQKDCLDGRADGSGVCIPQCKAHTQWLVPELADPVRSPDDPGRPPVPGDPE